MKIEDEVLKDLTNAERRAEKAEKNLKEAKRIAERERKAKEEATHHLFTSAKVMKDAGLSVEQIM